MVLHSSSSNLTVSQEKLKTLSPEATTETAEKHENTLRPKCLEDYIGQKEIKQNLSIFIQASKSRSESLEHVLLHGPPGLGKTTLAYILAQEMKANIRISSGPALERPGDIAAIITNLEEGDILFIDEIHRLKTVVEETLYSAMEDFAIDIVLGKGPSARSMRLNLPHFTLIGATTKLSLLSSPLRDRFGHNFRLNFYNSKEMVQIIERSAKILNMTIDQEAADRLALASRKTPRIANRLLRRMRDFAWVNGEKSIDHHMVETGLSQMGIDQEGLDETDRSILRLIVEKFQGGPVGLRTLAAATQEAAETLEEIYEPFLIQKGFLDRTHRGRRVTSNGYTHLGLKQTSNSI